MRPSKMTICTIALLLPVISGLSNAAEVYIDDGQRHGIASDTYEYDEVYLDYNVTNDPGTHVTLMDDGLVNLMVAFNNASVTMRGGNIDDLCASNNGSIIMSGGTVDAGLSARHNGSLLVAGGDINFIMMDDDSTAIISHGGIGDVDASGNTTTTIKGGNIGSVGVSDSAIIYLDGTNFYANGEYVPSGYALSDLGTYSGIITGTLHDGSTLSCNYTIENSGGTADIVIIPEPATLLLLGSGAVMLRQKRA